MKRALVIGCPGSGKSTFARRLREITGLPLYYLDRLYWNADRTVVSQDEFDRRLHAALRQDEWIIDGNYARTLEARLARCDTVFFLDYPAEVCLIGIADRRGIPREDMPWVETAEDLALTAFVRDFHDAVRPQIVQRLERAGGVKIHQFRSRTDAETYLKG
ncbi:MAG: adenylate kinase [Clostridia bacterium]|nr:adenylate kinase [Clostridia bacterium]